MTTNKIIPFTGIGSRDITWEEGVECRRIAQLLTGYGMTCYSGGARGADEAFAEGSTNMIVNWLPWYKFNGVYLKPGQVIVPRTELTETASWDIAEASIDLFHPNPSRLSPAARSMMFRNYFQVMGCPEKDLPKTEVIICCASEVIRNGIKEADGGTGQAVRIAMVQKIPVYNIRTASWLSGKHDFLQKFIDKK